MVRKLFFSLLIFLMIGVSIRVAHADEIIQEGETVSADLNISDDLQIETGGTLDANAHIFNGDADVAGVVTGNLLVIGGDVELSDTADIQGECVLVGGEVHANSSNTECFAIGTFDLTAPNLAVANAPDGPVAALPASLTSGNSLVGSLFGSLMFGVFAFLAANVAPQQLNKIGDTITLKPVVSGTVGVLTLFGAVSAVTLLTLISAVLLFVCIGILGVPIVLAMLGLLVAGLLLGWVAVGNIVGEIVADQLHLHKLNMPLTAALGTSLLSIAVSLIGMMPVIGFSSTLIWWLVGGIGLGAATLTRLGTRAYPTFVVRSEKLNQAMDTINI